MVASVHQLRRHHRAVARRKDDGSKSYACQQRPTSLPGRRPPNPRSFRLCSYLGGAGSYGIETNKEINPRAKYLSVRGPLTRDLVVDAGGECPRIYGDPTLLLSQFYTPKPTGDRWPLGIVFRWSEKERAKQFDIPGVNKIEIKTDDIEGTIDQICSCERIITTSLHIAITADVYNIPSAWLHTDTTTGGEFKFLDYFISVDKVRAAQDYNPSTPGMTLERLLTELNYADRPITFDPRPMIEVNPFGWSPSKIAGLGEAA